MKTITVETLPSILHSNIPVITTELLASLYCTDAVNIKMNHSRNQTRFECGKHYYKLEGIELKEFKNKVTESYLVASRAKHLILWTERGAARHAKMLETDQAWEVFERLEDCYFNNVSSGMVELKTHTKRFSCKTIVTDNETGAISELNIDARDMKEMVYLFGYNMGFAPHAYTLLPRSQLKQIN